MIILAYITMFSMIAGGVLFGIQGHEMKFCGGIILICLFLLTHLVKRNLPEKDFLNRD